MRKNKKWFNPKTTDTGWDKDMPADTRRALMLKAHSGDELAAARACQALSNVTKDKETRDAAAKDATVLFKMHQKRKQWGDKYIPTPPYHNGYHPEKEKKQTMNRANFRAPTMGNRAPRITERSPRLR